MEAVPRKSPILAGILSGIMPGLGQFYNRQWIKGAGFLAGLLVLTVALGRVADEEQLERAATTGVPLDNPGPILLLLLLLLALVIWSVVDAVRTAKRSQP